MGLYFCVLFFFSSRRRHTRSDRDWSSDVCSSDLQVIAACGPNFSVLSGDDNLTLPLLAIGGPGVGSLIAHIVPREGAGMVHPAPGGGFKRARGGPHPLFPPARPALPAADPDPVHG